ncbi:hypothetical protein [Sphingomonas morindae]|uniref:MFS transporter n=1 Tax=Sphingomonas morindae TaxID=1541170 RepID=A0ABY4X9L8_9SPHN|nr:hypothetical protein [Sphingomonas morindae]USI73416.1 hypothetical protein LHA26_02750 [Sphingomonas morindae]
MAEPTQDRARSGARLALRIGQSVGVEAAISSAALLALGALVSGILLSSAVIVRAARPGGGPAGRDEGLGVEDGTQR